jgi:hypothetical protein
MCGGLAAKEEKSETCNSAFILSFLKRKKNRGIPHLWSKPLNNNNFMKTIYILLIYYPFC